MTSRDRPRVPHPYRHPNNTALFDESQTSLIDRFPNLRDLVLEDQNEEVSEQTPIGLLKSLKTLGVEKPSAPKTAFEPTIPSDDDEQLNLTTSLFSTMNELSFTAENTHSEEVSIETKINAWQLSNTAMQSRPSDQNATIATATNVPWRDNGAYDHQETAAPGQPSGTPYQQKRRKISHGYEPYPRIQQDLGSSNRPRPPIRSNTTEW